MRNIFHKVAQSLREVYHRAEDLLEEEREIPLSQNFLNAFIQQYVTDRVEKIDEMHADIYDGWARLFATVHYKGIQAQLSTDLLLIQLQLDPDTQQIVFEQQGGTHMIDLHVDQPWKRIGVLAAIWVVRHVLHRDPLALILEKLDIIEIKHDLLYLDLARYIAHKEKVMRALRKVHINHAVLRLEQFVLKGNLNLAGIFGGRDDGDLPDDDEPFDRYHTDEDQTLRTVYDESAERFVKR